eukprot:GHUV01047375.1.p1 GENE.GHUV01047375.1~~GHUV01047375.1.p1  ORF type:complete len:195 (+),score=59.65 GHUV01047375.1:610-1194(+)
MQQPMTPTSSDCSSIAACRCNPKAAPKTRMLLAFLCCYRLSEFANANQTAAAPTGDNFMRPSDSESSASADEPEAGTTVADWHHPQQVYQQELLQQQQQLHQQQTDSRAPISINTGAVAAVDLAAKLDSSSLGHRGSGKHSSSRGQVAGGNVPQQGHCDSCSSEEEDDSLPPLQQINNRRVHYELSDDSDSLDE